MIFLNEKKYTKCLTRKQYIYGKLFRNMLKKFFLEKTEEMNVILS